MTSGLNTGRAKKPEPAPDDWRDREPIFSELDREIAIDEDQARQLRERAEKKLAAGE